jgi:polysaccharide biosynthesis transport protein
VLTSPRAASEPTKPQPGRTAGLALVVGLLTGAALAGARDAYSAKFRAAGDAEAALGLPVLARIPAVPRLAKPSPTPPTDRENHDLAAIATAYLALRSPGGSERQATVDLTREEFESRRRDRTILVTSAVAREGKSTVASRLAVSLAGCGRRVLLVDANLRRPTQQALFELGRGPGLADVLAGRATLDDAIRPTSAANLEVLTAGRTAADPLVLLNRAELVEMLEQVAEVYDHVIVDSPAVRGSDDARVIAAACDATLLVLRNTEANLRTGIHARDALAVVGANVVGIIVNTVPQAAAPSKADAADPTARRQRPASPLVSTPAERAVQPVPTTEGVTDVAQT